MDTDARAQIRLLLEDIVDRAQSKTERALDEVYSQHAASGRLQSGATIKIAIRNLEKGASEMIARAVDAVAGVAKDIEAFAIIAEVVQRFESHLESLLNDAIDKGTGKKSNTSMASADRAARQLFGEAKARWRRQLELHRFTFTVPTLGVKRHTDITKGAVDAPTAIKNKGGKPLASHWDELWATIAVALWTGDIDPKSQADIKRAMFGWFNDQGIEVGDTAVTARARQLWQKIEASK